MLSRRQIEILLELCESPNNYITATTFAQKQQVSLRTIQNDIRAIKEELQDTPGLEFYSVSSKGSRVLVTEERQFSQFKEELYNQFGNVSMNCQNERIDKLLMMLLQQHRSESYYDIESKIFVSHSTLLKDLKQVDEILQKYNLELLRGASKLVVEGSEINKRQCISEENLLLTNCFSILSGSDDSNPMIKIKDILVESFVAFRHSVSEVELNNMIILLYVAVKRIEDWFYIAPTEVNITQELHPETELAQEIFQKISDEFHLRIPEPEINYFALYLRGRANSDSTAVISEELDELVLDGLREIRKTFNIDLTNDMNFRIALALHCAPLIVRVKYDMQLKNHLVNYIRRTYPQGFDMATYFASFLQKRFHKKINDEEIAFIAIHMYKALTDLENGTGTKRILVISSLRRSENTLIRQSLYQWFHDQIAELTFVSPSEMNESYLDKYDTFLTTEKGRFYDMGLAFYINAFPDQHDYLNIKLAMDGFKSIDDILQIFHKDLFTVLEGEQTRDQVLELLCKKAEKDFNLAGFHEAVIERESLGSTFFGNGIAAPHPIQAVSSYTFIAIAVSPQPMEWDEDGNKVNLTMLVSVGKNNSKAFQIWNYLSKIFAHRDFLGRLLQNPSYENFLNLLKSAITEDFNR